MKTVNVLFADGREILVDLRYPATIERAREICERRYRLETVVAVTPCDAPIRHSSRSVLQARSVALNAIRELGI